MRPTVPAHLPAKSYLETEAGSQRLSEQKLNSEMRFQGGFFPLVSSEFGRYLANAPTPPHQSLGRSHKPVIVSNSRTQEEHRAHTGRSRAPWDASKMHGTIAFYTCGYSAQHKNTEPMTRGPSPAPLPGTPRSRRVGAPQSRGPPNRSRCLHLVSFRSLSPGGFVLHFCICFILNVNGKVRGSRSEMGLSAFNSFPDAGLGCTI